MDSTNFAGNNGLCKSGSYHCHLSIPSPTPNKNWIKESSSRAKLVTIISGAIGLVSLFFIVGLCWAMIRRQPAFVSLEEATRPDVEDNYYFPKEGFSYTDILVATGNFSEDAVIGKGACGTVYKAVMADGEVHMVTSPQGPTSEIFDRRLDLSQKSTIEEMSLGGSSELSIRICTSRSPIDEDSCLLRLKGRSGIYSSMS
ncbi:hypothetical protein OIU76_025686 [Salix suchowensis]|nr:hypothetical protein OIU76_025686 [Salix suchowensis]